MTTTPALLMNRRTKIVATLGPASASPEMIERLLRAGVDVFRLNMSHGDHAGHRQAFDHIRDLARRHSVYTAVLADLSGPKIRVGTFPPGGIPLVAGSVVTVTVRRVTGEPGLIPSQYEALADDVSSGDVILLADGLMQLEVLSVQGTEISCRVVQGGQLTDRKGINLPGVEVSAPCLTEKDKADAAFAMALGVDFLALSFVRRASDVADLRALIEAHRPQRHDAPGIVAKIERPEGLARSTEILTEADAVMVARGDLGVELPPEEVPIAQQHLIDQARRIGRPVIVATQMLESMIDNARPTRAEVADVSLSVANGTDAVMLSGETAAGRYPLEAVGMMDRVARRAEAQLWEHGAFGSLTRREDAGRPLPFGDAVARATALLSRDLRVRAIMVLSESGRSASTLSCGRPGAPVVAISSRPSTVRRLSLLWGVIPILVEPVALEDPPALVRGLACRLHLASRSDFILMVRGFNASPEQNTPSITLLSV